MSSTVLPSRAITISVAASGIPGVLQVRRLAELLPHDRDDRRIHLQVLDGQIDRNRRRHWRMPSRCECSKGCRLAFAGLMERFAGGELPGHPLEARVPRLRLRDGGSISGGGRDDGPLRTIRLRPARWSPAPERWSP